MTKPNALDEQIRKAVKDGLSNHTGEFANPWIFKKSYSREELADILNDIMASERLFKNLEALFTEHSKEEALKELFDFREQWHTMIRQEVHQDLNERIAQLKRNKGEDNE